MIVKYKPTGQIGEIPDDKFDPAIFEPAQDPRKQQAKVAEIRGSMATPSATPKTQSVATQNPSSGGGIRDMAVDMLPTIGAVGGGFVGGMAAGGVGAIPLAAAGAGVGEALKQRIKGEGIDVSKMRNQAAFGAAGEGAGQLIGAGLKVAGKVVGKAGENLATRSIRPSPSQQAGFLEKTGSKFKDFAVKNGLIQKGTEQVDALIEPAQQAFDDIAKNSGIKISPGKVVSALQAKAKEYLADTSPALKSKGAEIMGIAKNFAKKYGKKAQDISVFSNERMKFDKLVKQFKLDPEKAGFNQDIREVLQGVIQDATAGMKIGGKSLDEIGTTLRDLYEFRKIAGKQEFIGTGGLPVGLLPTIGGGAGFASSITSGDPKKIAQNTLIGAGLPLLANNPKFVAATSRLMMGAGERAASGSLPAIVSGADRIAGQGIIQGADALFGGSEQTEQKPTNSQNTEPHIADYSATMPQSQELPPITGYSTRELAEAYTAAIAAGDKATAAVLKQMYDTQSGFEKAPATKKTESQQARDDVAYLAGEAIRQLDAGTVKTGLISPRLEEAKSIVNRGDPSTLAFNNTISQIKGTIAKARGGTSFTPSEEKLLNQYTPQIGDSEQKLRVKLQGLKDFFVTHPGVQIVPDNQVAFPDITGEGGL